MLKVDIGILLVGQEVRAACYYKDIMIRNRTEKQIALHKLLLLQPDSLLQYGHHLVVATITLTFTTITTVSVPATTTSITIIFEVDARQTPSL